MKKFSYDYQKGYLWSWDGDFLFEGEFLHDELQTGASLDDTFNKDNREFLEAVGALFLSGYRRDAVVIWYDDEIRANVRMGKINGLGSDVMENGWQNVLSFVTGRVKGNFPIVLCGKAASNPKTVAEFCAAFPSRSVYVCPVVDELAAFGNLVLNVDDKPRKATLWFPNSEPLDAPFKEYNPKLKGDGLGRMAHLVRKGLAVYNDMRRGVGIPTFYGNVLHDGRCGDRRFIVRADEVDKFFPTTPLSAKLNASNTVFVSMVPSAAFRDASGVTSETVDVIVATEYIPELPTFMNFYKVMSKMGFVGVSEPKNITFTKTMPLFRYDKAYRTVDINAR